MAELINLGEPAELRKLRERTRVHSKALVDRLFSEIKGQPVGEICAMYAALAKLAIVCSRVLPAHAGIPTKAINELIQEGKL